MSLHEYKMASLKDKIRNVEESKNVQEEVVSEKTEQVEKVVIKKRRLSK